MMNEINNWRPLNNSNFDKDFHMKLITSEKITVCRVDITDKIVLQSHSHENEQISYIISGEMLIKYGKIEKIMKAGDVCIIPSNIVHSVEILSCPFQSIDIFSPIRVDYLNLLEKKFQ